MRCQSAPLQRRRTLDEFPMDYSRGETQNLSQYWRHQRNLKEHSILKACAESENQRQYSRRMFDYVVKNVKSDPSKNRKISCDYLPVQNYSGPSHIGSPLYNKTPALLSSIRLRPKSHIGAIEHQQSSYPDIKKTLSQSNCNYKVAFTNKPQFGSPRNSPTCRSVTSEYLLIPKNPSDKSLNGSVFEWSELIESEKQNGLLSREEIPELRTESQFRSHPRRYVAPSISSASSSSLSSSTQMLSPRSDKQENTELQDQTDQVMEQREETPEDVSPHQVIKTPKKPVEPSSTPRRKKVRPRCWVDDVTVSSDPSVHTNPTEAELEETADINLEKPPDQIVDAGASAEHPTLPVPKPHSPPTVEFKDPLVTEVPEERLIAEEAVLEDVNVINLDDLKEQKIELPKFICPSSETKSRQTAIKDWLASTSFTCANRQIPLF
ncbi:hypothetical protein SNE40_012391 [Patella caerulea]